MNKLWLVLTVFLLVLSMATSVSSTCVGTSLPCSTWNYNETCNSQLGCAADGPCNGEHWPCDFNGICAGTSIGEGGWYLDHYCEDIIDSDICAGQSPCEWNGTYCSGGVYEVIYHPCLEINNATDCNSHDECKWYDTNRDICNSQLECSWIDSSTPSNCYYNELFPNILFPILLVFIIIFVPAWFLTIFIKDWIGKHIKGLGLLFAVSIVIIIIFMYLRCFTLGVMR